MKTFMSFFVFSALILGTLFSFQVWQKEQNTHVINNIQQLNYETKVETLSAPSGKSLVPIGAVLGLNDVNTISYTYLVQTDNEEEFEVIPTNVFLTKDNQIFEADSFLNFSYSVEKIDTTKSRVTVDITLNMPNSEAEYNLINRSSMSFQFIFR